MYCYSNSLILFHNYFHHHLSLSYPIQLSKSLLLYALNLAAFSLNNLLVTVVTLFPLHEASDVFALPFVSYIFKCMQFSFLTLCCFNNLSLLQALQFVYLSVQKRDYSMSLIAGTLRQLSLYLFFPGQSQTPYLKPSSLFLSQVGHWTPYQRSV